MRKLLIALIVGVMTIGIMGCKATVKPALAEVNVPDLLAKIPANHQCLVFNLTDSKWDYATVFTFAKVWKDKISFDVGYSPSSELLGAMSIKLIEVKDWIKFPILSLMEIEPMIWVGMDRIENIKELGQYNYGVGVKLLEIKF